MEINLNSDVYIEILSRITPKRLDRLKLVCKEWNRLLYEPIFRPLHIQRTDSVYGYFVQSSTAKTFEYTWEFVSIERRPGIESAETDKLNLSMKHLLPLRKGDDFVKIVACSEQGLVCCEGRRLGMNNYRMYSVFKPSTGQWEALECPRIQFSTKKVALAVLSSNPLRFKVIRLSTVCEKKCPIKPEPKECYKLKYEIFDSKTWEWRLLEDIVLPPSEHLTKGCAISVGGELHFLTTHDRVLAFHKHHETWTMFPLPLSLSESQQDCYKNKQLVQFQGRWLGFLGHSPDKCLVDVWIRKEGCSGTAHSESEWEWEKIQTLNLQAVVSAESEHTDWPLIPKDLYNSNTLVLSGYRCVIFLRLHDNNVVKMKLDEIEDPDEVFLFRSDLEQFYFFNSRGQNMLFVKRRFGNKFIKF